MEARFDFLAPVSPSGAKKMRNQFWNTMQEVKENPFQFPLDLTISVADCNYRKALFGRNYKILFYIEEKIIVVDAVVDCRMDPETILRELE